MLWPTRSKAYVTKTVSDIPSLAGKEPRKDSIMTSALRGIWGVWGPNMNNMAYYEEIKNFRPIMDTAISLLRGRGQDRYCQIVLQAVITVANTDYDNWDGGTYGYTVFIDLPVNVYAQLKKDEIDTAEKVLAETFNEVIKGDEHSFFIVQIAPKFTVSDINWDLIGGESARNQLERDLLAIKDVLISVATGGARINEVEERYKKLQKVVSRQCNQLRIQYDNGFESLWDWYGRWRDGLTTYQSRRDFISELLKPTFAAFDSDSVGSSVIMPIVDIDEWDRINRVVIKIKRDSAVAKNAEDYQQIGLLCRELIISLAQAVYNPALHGEKDDNGVVIGKTDAMRMVGNYINVKLAGSSNEELRSYAKTTNKLANLFTHKRDATRKDMLMTVAATIALINFVVILEDKG